MPGSITLPAHGDTNWDTTLNTAINSLQTQINAIPSPTAGSSVGSTYYVGPSGSDANDGLSPASPKATVSGALAAFSGPGRVVLMPGTVTTNGAGTGGADLTDRQAVTVEGYSGATPGGALCIVQHNDTGTVPAFKLLRASGCTLRNFEIQYTSGSFTGNVVDLTGDTTSDSPLNMLDGITIVSANTSTIRSARAGIAVDASDDKTIRNCVVHDCQVGVYGLTSTSTSTSYANAVSIENCHFSRNAVAHIRNPGNAWFIKECVFEPVGAAGSTAITAGAVVTDSGYFSDGLTITGCWCGDLGSGGGGTQFAVCGRGVQVVANFIGISGSSGATGVSVLPNASGVVVRGNKFHGSTASETGILVDTSVVSYDTTGNAFTNVSTPYASAGLNAMANVDIQSAKVALLITNHSTSDGRATIKFQADRTSTKAYEMGIDVTGGASKWWELYDRTAGVSRLKVTTGGSVVLNASGTALATGATDGYVYLPSCGGTPSGTPASTFTGAVPCLVDSAAGKLWAYVGGAWKSVTFA